MPWLIIRSIPSATFIWLTSIPESRRRRSNTGLSVAITKVASPPKRRYACANAKHRIIWPVPILVPASARMRIALLSKGIYHPSHFFNRQKPLVGTWIVLKIFRYWVSPVKTSFKISERRFDNIIVFKFYCIVGIVFWDHNLMQFLAWSYPHNFSFAFRAQRKTISFWKILCLYHAVFLFGYTLH